MKILMTGGTGLVGHALVEQFKDEEIYILTRSNKQSTGTVHYINWNEEDWINKVPEVDLVINLAGASLNKRWTSEYKEAIVNSRIETTRKLQKYFQRSKAFFVTASAVGYYPPSKGLTYTESDQFMPFDFLSETVHVWEQEAKNIELKYDVSTAYCRFGVVFSNEGGALPLMVLPYRLMGGGTIASGQQPYSWIHIDDLVRGIKYIYEQRAAGVFNMTAPDVVTQQQLGQAIARTIHRPHWTKLPSSLFNLVLGEQAIMVTQGQRVLPKHLKNIGFDFKYPTIEQTLEELYGQ